MNRLKNGSKNGTKTIKKKITHGIHRRYKSIVRNKGVKNMKTEKVLDLIKQFDKLDEKERDFLGYMIDIIRNNDIDTLVDTYLLTQKMHNEYDLGEKQIYNICYECSYHSMLRDPLFSIREDKAELTDYIVKFCKTDPDWDEYLPLLDRFNLYKEYLPLFTELFNNGQLENFYNLYFRWNMAQTLLAMNSMCLSISDIVSSFADLIKDEEEKV